MTFPQAPLAQLVVGGTISYGVVQPGTENTEGVPILRVKDLRGNQIDLSEPIRVSHDVSERHGRTILQGGEVLVSLVGSVGLAAVTDERVRGWNVARAIAVLRPVPEIGPQWLQLCLQSRAAQDQIRERLNTTVQATLNLADLKMIKVPVPDSTTRAAIAAVVGALDDKIAANDALARAADDLAAATFSAMLEDDGFVSTALEDLCQVNAQVTKPATGSIRYIDIASLGTGVIPLGQEMEWSNAPSRARRALRSGDTIWSTLRPNRRQFYLNLDSDPSLIGSTGLAVLSPTRVPPAYLYECTRRQEFTDYLISVAEGSAYPAVRPEQFRKAPVPLVADSNVLRFDKFAAPLRALLESIHLESTTLAELRDTLLPALMSGRLRVRDAERDIEDAV